MSQYAGTAFTAAVRQVQQEMGSAEAMVRRASLADGSDRFGQAEADFIQARDGFYLATVSESGWPYLQFRGGPPGFVRVQDEQTLAFAVVRGNRQYITTGNLRDTDRIALFFMDYPSQRRLKVYGRAVVRSLDFDPELTRTVSQVRSTGPLESIMCITLHAWSWNCPKGITPRYNLDELHEALEPVRELLRRYEAENERLRSLVADQSASANRS